MGLCLCKGPPLCPEKLKDDLQLAERHFIDVGMKELRKKIEITHLPIIWLEGTENSGKENLASNIAQRLGYTHIQVESIILADAEKKSRRGKLVKDKIITQSKIPDRLVIELIKEAMVAAGDTSGFLVSSFPQNTIQAKHFVKEVTKVDCMVYLEGKTTEATEPTETSTGDSIAGMSTCESQGQIIPPKTEEKSQSSLTYSIKSNSSFEPKKYAAILEKIDVSESSDVIEKIEAVIMKRTHSGTQ